ncbi:hypothetical protein ACYPKM_00890 [Pseudomonas aeruginosa]
MTLQSTREIPQSIFEMMALVTTAGFSAEDFWKAALDQPCPSAYGGALGAEAVALEWLAMAKAGRLAVFQFGSEHKDGRFEPYSLPWIFDSRSETVGVNSIEILEHYFPNRDMSPIHWGYGAELLIESGIYADRTRSEVLFFWADAARNGRLEVDFTNVVAGQPYRSQIKVTIKPKGEARATAGAEPIKGEGE